MREFELVRKKQMTASGLASVTLASPRYKVTIYRNEVEGEVQYPVRAYAIGKGADVRPDVVFLARGNAELRFPPAVPIEKADILVKDMEEVENVAKEVDGWISKLERREELSESLTEVSYYEIDTNKLPDVVMDKGFVVRDELEKVDGAVFCRDGSVFLPENAVSCEDEFIEWLKEQNVVGRTPDVRMCDKDDAESV